MVYKLCWCCWAWFSFLCPSSACRILTFQGRDIISQTGYRSWTPRGAALYCFSYCQCGTTRLPHCYPSSDGLLLLGSIYADWWAGVHKDQWCIKGISCSQRFNYYCGGSVVEKQCHWSLVYPKIGIYAECCSKYSLERYRTAMVSRWDRTCAHIEVIKNPSDFSNNQNYESQICRHLDRAEKCQRFDLFTAVEDAGVDFRATTKNFSEDDCASVASDDSMVETTANLVDQIDPVSALSGMSLPSHVDYFAKAADLKKIPMSSRVPQARPHTFSLPQAAFHLNRDPSFNMPIDDVATLFNIPVIRWQLSYTVQCTTKQTTKPDRSATCDCDVTERPQCDKSEGFCNLNTETRRMNKGVVVDVW